MLLVKIEGTWCLSLGRTHGTHRCLSDVSSLSKRQREHTTAASRREMKRDGERKIRGDRSEDEGERADLISKRE